MKKVIFVFMLAVNYCNAQTCEDIVENSIKEIQACRVSDAKSREALQVATAKMKVDSVFYSTELKSRPKKVKVIKGKVVSFFTGATAMFVLLLLL